MTIEVSPYSFIKNNPPDQWHQHGSAILYYQKDYLNCQNRPPDRSFWIIEKKQFETWGQVHFWREEDEAISHKYAPFGSFQGGALPKSVLKQFASYIEHELQSWGVSKITYHHCPDFYQNTKWVQVLRERGYLWKDDPNHHILVNAPTLLDRLHGMEQRKLKRSDGLTLTYHKPEEAVMVYQFLNQCREERNQKLSLTREDFTKIIQALPLAFLLPAVYKGDQMIAASVVIKVNQQVWYSFYPGHLLDFQKLSPMVFLLKSLYEKAYENDVKHLDLGTSQINGSAIPTLMQFKMRMGAVEGVKTTLHKKV